MARVTHANSPGMSGRQHDAVRAKPANSGYACHFVETECRCSYTARTTLCSRCGWAYDMECEEPKARRETTENFACNFLHSTIHCQGNICILFIIQNLSLFNFNSQFLLALYTKLGYKNTNFMFSIEEKDKYNHFNLYCIYKRCFDSGSVSFNFIS